MTKRWIVLALTVLVTGLLWSRPLHAADGGTVTVITAPRGPDQPAWVIVRDGANPALLRRQAPVPATQLADAAASPDGRYLAYYRGDISLPAEPLRADLALHILRLADGVDVRAIPLAAPDFPANIARTAELLTARDTTLATIVDFDEAIWMAYRDGLRRLAWSPDGTRLAFSGSMDGPTSDLYLYTPADDSIQRLSDGIEQMDRLRWSPDGRWIWHGTVSFAYCQACDGGQYAAAADGSAMITLPGDDVHRFLGWLDDTHFLQTDQANGPGDFELAAVDLTNGAAAILWPGTHERFALDWSGQRLALIGTPGRQWDPNVRLYGVDLQTGDVEERAADGLSPDDPDPLVAALSGANNRPCATTPIIRPCEETPYNPAAPDGAAYVAADGSLVDPAGTVLLPPVPAWAGARILWQPDGSGYYGLQQGTLFYRDRATGALKRLARHVQRVELLPAAN